jgi:hypothetical protein
METRIKELEDALVEAGFRKNMITKDLERIEFRYKKITYSVNFDGDDLMFGPLEFENGTLDSDYLFERYTEYGTFEDFKDYLYTMINEQPLSVLYSITDKLLKLEETASMYDIELSRIVHIMFH